LIKCLLCTNFYFFTNYKMGLDIFGDKVKFLQNAKLREEKEKLLKAL